MKVRRARGESSQYRPLASIEVAAKASDQRLAGIGRLERLWFAFVERIGAAVDAIYGKCRHRADQDQGTHAVRFCDCHDAVSIF